MKKIVFVLLLIIFINPVAYTGLNQCYATSGRTILVDDDADDDPINLTWNTINKGLQNANRGDTIKIYNGTYTEHLIVDIQNLKLLGQPTDLFGDDTSGVIVDGSGTNDIITITATGLTISGLIIQQSGIDLPGILVQTDFTNIEKNIIKDCSIGIKCTNGKHLIVEDSTFINFSTTAIDFTNCDDVTISNNQIFGYGAYGKKGIRCELTKNMLIDNNHIFTDQTGIGIELFHLSQYNEISRNIIENNTQGITLSWSANENSIIDNIIINSTGDAIYLDFSSSVQPSKIDIIDNHIINNSGYGLYLFHAREATIENNEINGSGNDGIYCEWSNYSTFSKNHIINNDDGIYQTRCMGNIFQANTITCNDDGMYVSASENTKILDNKFWNNTNTVTVEDSQNTKIIGNTLKNNTDGISLFTQANENIISNNHIINNTRYGLILTFAKKNNITENIFENNKDTGVYVDAKSDDNHFYHNLFINNTIHACDSCENNWDDGYSGNYWDDYIGEDTDDNGIGDTPYNIPCGSNRDNFPFMNPYGWNTLPDLNCDGSISWNLVKPKSIQQGSFIIKNVGTSGSKLDWNITDWPDWGEWTFTPQKNGDDLTPEAGEQIITVFVVVPNQPLAPYEGYITIENRHNNDDSCTVPVSLSTSKNKPLGIQHILEQWLSHFPLSYLLIH